MTQMHFDYKHYYPRLLTQPMVKLSPTEQKKQSKTTMRSRNATIQIEQERQIKIRNPHQNY